ncbi:MAG: C-type lectin domain-containing protein, partial [Actinomycetota bacterium]|nr:C-type lectin domain-containing protein [Actinomycetota bacterium]
DGGGTPCLLPATGDGTPHFDGFFVFTTPNAGDFEFDLLGTGWDTVIQVHLGSDCTAACLAYDDDANGFPPGESKVTLPGLAAAADILIQIGGWNPATPGAAGSLTITEVFPPPPPVPVLNTANGHYYIHLDTNLTWPDAKTAAEGMTFQGMTGHLVTINDQAEMDWLLNNLTWDRPWIGGWQDPTDAGYSEPNGGWVWVTGEPMTFTNWIPGEPNDNPAGENSIELLFNLAGSATVNGGWNDTVENSGSPHTYIVEYESAQGITTSCSPANDHFLGNNVKLSTSAFGSGVGSDLHIEAIDGPAGEFGFVMVSADDSALLSIFNGVLCLGTPQGRYNPGIATNQGLPQLNSLGQFDAAGIMQNIVGTAPSSGGSGFDVPGELPYAPPGQFIQTGETWYFQVWYRDLGGSCAGGFSNLTNAWTVTFTP